MRQTEAKSSIPPPRKPKPGLVVDLGKKVDIFGLRGASQYNGMEGRITAGPNEKGRWLVQLIYQGNMKELALQTENLQPKPPCGWELVAAGISMSTTEEDIARVFSKFGQVQHVKVTRDLNGLSKGVALIVMSHRDAAEKALNMVEVDICGIGVKLQWSTMVKQEMGLLKTREEEGKSMPTPASQAPVRRTFQEQHPDEVPDSATPIRAGQTVMVSGLKGQPQFNGATGVVQSVRADGRCEVLLEAKILALKPENLTVVEAGSAAGRDAPPTSGRRRFSEDAGTAQAHTILHRAEQLRGASCVKAAAAPAPAGAADPAAKEPEPPRRRRKSAWGENEGGEVYVGVGSKSASSGGGVAAAATAATPEPEPLPGSEAELAAMSAGAIRRLLESRKVDLAGCIEKGDYLAKARDLLAAPS